MQDQDLDNRNPKKNSWLVPFLVSSTVIGILAAIALPGFFNQAAMVKKHEAKMAITIALRIQLENYKDKGRFISSWDEIPMGLRPTSYDFKVSIKRDTIVIITASPKSDGLSSFSGVGVGLAKWICQTLEPSRTPPQIDEYLASECPAGSTILKLD